MDLLPIILLIILYYDRTDLITNEKNASIPVIISFQHFLKAP